jgi:hypothetical protein
MLLVIGACFAAAFWWLGKIARPGPGTRVLTGPGTVTARGRPEGARS